jgi:hypothetical protein
LSNVDHNSGIPMIALLLLMLLSGMPSGDEMTGRISNRMGQSVSEAKVCTATWNCTKSDKDGGYRVQKVPSRQEMIWVSHAGSKPVLSPINGLSMDVVLESADPSNAQWILPRCKLFNEENGRYVGDGRLRVFVPEKTHNRTSTDSDYWMVSITHGPKKELLRIGAGPTWSMLGFPSWPDTVKELALREVILPSADSANLMVDVRGRSTDEKLWRFTGDSFESRQYEAVSKEAAEEFDRIIDTLCVEGHTIQGK